MRWQSSNQTQTYIIHTCENSVANFYVREYSILQEYLLNSSNHIHITVSTPDKYEQDLENIRYTFTKSIIRAHIHSDNHTLTCLTMSSTPARWTRWTGETRFTSWTTFTRWSGGTHWTRGAAWATFTACTRWTSWPGWTHWTRWTDFSISDCWQITYTLCMLIFNEWCTDPFLTEMVFATV